MSTKHSSWLFSIPGMSCSSCVNKIEQQIKPLEGVEQVQINLMDKTLEVIGHINPDDIENKLDTIGYPGTLVKPTHSSQASDTVLLQITNISCSSCVNKIEQCINRHQGVEQTQVNPIDKTVHITGNPHIASVLASLKDIGYPAEIIEDDQTSLMEQTQHNTAHEIKSYLARSAVAAMVGLFIFVPEMLVSQWNLLPDLTTGNKGLLNLPPQPFWIAMLVITLATMYYSGGHYYTGAIKQLKHLSSNMDSLVALGTGAAWLYSAIVILIPHMLPPSMLHIFLDASVLILAFINFGHALEAKAKGKSSQAIQKLLGMQAKTATVIQDDQEIQIPVDRLSVGDQVRVLPGEKMPIDGQVHQGKTSADESMLTGEPIAVSKQPGDTVYAGTINQTGSIVLTVTATASESALSQIIALVKSAQASKPAIGKLVDKVTAVFVPIVVVIALSTFIIWCFFSVPHAISTAIAVLVIACPCALGLGTPMAIMIGSGKSAEFGVLLRNGQAIQSASELDYIVFDKTGTITQGKPQVTNIDYADQLPLPKDKLLACIMAIEKQSEHPLGAAIVNYLSEQNVTKATIDNFESHTGKGVIATVDQHQVYIGNAKLFEQQQADLSQYQSIIDKTAQSGATPVMVGVDNQFACLIAIQDPIKPDSKTAIEQLKNTGLKTAMITGDNQRTAQSIAAEVGIDEVFAEVMPEDKANYIKQLQQQGYQVGMVGDGINDAPALTQANIGFAMGQGTDIAIESADVTLVNHSLNGVNNAITLSKIIMRNIKQSLFGAFIYNIIGIPIAAGLLYPFFGILLDPIFASGAMALSSVTVVLNASRLRTLKLLK